MVAPSRLLILYHVILYYNYFRLTDNKPGHQDGLREADFPARVVPLLMNVLKVYRWGRSVLNDTISCCFDAHHQRAYGQMLLEHFIIVHPCRSLNL